MFDQSCYEILVKGGQDIAIRHAYVLPLSKTNNNVAIVINYKISHKVLPVGILKCRRQLFFFQRTCKMGWKL